MNFKWFKKRHLIVVVGIIWWLWKPIHINIPIQLLVTFGVYWIADRIVKKIYPGVPKVNELTNYDPIRPHLKTGDVIAFGGEDLFANAIRWKDKTPFSHVGTVIRISDLAGDDRVFVLESVTESGVILMPLSAKLASYRGTASWFALAPVSTPGSDYRTKIYHYLMLQLGKKYDFMDIRNFVAMVLLKIKSPTDDASRMICSELVARGLQEAGLCKFENCSNVSPGDIVKLKDMFKPEVKIL